MMKKPSVSVDNKKRPKLFNVKNKSNSQFDKKRPKLFEFDKRPFNVKKKTKPCDKKHFVKKVEQSTRPSNKKSQKFYKKSSNSLALPVIFA